MNPIPFGAPENAYDTSADNYLTECAGCHEQEWRDDLDEDMLCDACVKERFDNCEPPNYLGTPKPLRPYSADTHRERMDDSAYHDNMGI